VIPDITGYPLKAFELDMFVDAMIGIHMTIALEHLLENKPVDVPTVARQVTTMFAAGLGRSSTPAKKGTARAAKRSPTKDPAAGPAAGHADKTAAASPRTA
jgi:hypothetical protein